jgi:hypothetical protein
MPGVDVLLLQERVYENVPGAWEQLWAVLRASVERVVVSFVHDDPGTRDVLQDVQINLWCWLRREPRSLPLDELSKYANTIGRHLCYARYHGERRFVVVADIGKWLADENASLAGSDIPDERIRRSLLWPLLLDLCAGSGSASKLSASLQCRKSLVARILYPNHDYEALGRRLEGIGEATASAGTIAVRIHRALADLDPSALRRPPAGLPIAADAGLEDLPGVCDSLAALFKTKRELIESWLRQRSSASKQKSPSERTAGKPASTRPDRTNEGGER